MQPVSKFIERFHISEKIDTVFTQGCCYWFAYILHTRFSSSRIMYDEIINHYMTEIDGRLYDITGDVTDQYPDAKPWDDMKDELLVERLNRDCIMF